MVHKNNRSRYQFRQRSHEDIKDGNSDEMIYRICYFNENPCSKNFVILPFLNVPEDPAFTGVKAGTFSTHGVHTFSKAYFVWVNLTENLNQYLI